MNTNPMLPYPGKLVEVRDLADEIKLLRVELVEQGAEAFKSWQPGQFAFVSAYGLGEAPFGIANMPKDGSLLDFAVARLGSVTTGLHELGEGDTVGVRGPLGNCFPLEKFKGKNLVVLGGGIGGAPLRPVIQAVLSQRDEYDSLTILWAARKQSLLVFTDEYDAWRAAPDTRLHLTIDQADPKWDHNVGLITDLLKKVNPSPNNAISVTCGPPIMIYYVTRMLAEMGFRPEDNYVTLEARMHCGLGKCGRCNLGDKFVCVDGPVFNMLEVGNMMETYL
ncbi:MAG TPA: FAD/NAD(P)-binding protein [Anaerolineales bacterium]